jgi:putative hydrolase of the HAD superfamily
MSGRVRAVLSDLDDTLFDHAHATRCALRTLRDEVAVLGECALDELERRHRTLLDALHAEVLAGRMSIDIARVERFRRLIATVAPDRAGEAAQDAALSYRRAYAASWRPVAGALALVGAIKDAGLTLAVVTNNVVHEQRRKLEHCGLAPFVDVLVASEEAGVAKPDRAIFDAALGRVGATAAEAVMLGDAWDTDIEGARRAGVRAVWLNRLGAERPDHGGAADDGGPLHLVDELRSLEPTAEAIAVLRK